MKAVVLEITGNEATIMTRDGDIIGIRNKDYAIGQEINIKAHDGKITSGVLRFAPLAASMAAAAVLIIGGISMYFRPYGTVSLDINPSIEYTINRFDRVLSVSGVNDDGGDILSELNTDALINRNIEDAVDATIEQIAADGYLVEDDDNYMVVSANTKVEDHTDQLLQKLDVTVKGHQNIEAMTFKVTDDELQEAHREGISAGKKKMVDTLESASGGIIDRSEWNNRSVRDIIRERDRMQEKQPDAAFSDENGQNQEFMPGEPPEGHEEPEGNSRPQQSGQPEGNEPPQQSGQPEGNEPPQQGGQPEWNVQPEQNGQPEWGEPPAWNEQPEQGGQPQQNRPPEWNEPPQ
ncbi:MAG: anti-sigma factor domain-containing protein [Lachnospiraceae bacterium]|nr:anti-sigma factor domain-containing protein [Lachnospiraceae bacterium]